MDLNFLKKSRFIFLFLIFFVLIFLPVLYHLYIKNNSLPIYNPSDINPKLVDKSIRINTKNLKIGNFTLINQNGKIITQDNYKNKIYVADFFFSKCKGICIPMANNMFKLQEYFKNDNDVMFLSHSVTPKIDSVTRLKKYAINKGVIDSKWNVTTGDKKHIYNLARKSYFAVLDYGDGGDQDFIHTENFILIDKKGRIRGIYDGTKSENVQKIINDINIIKNEENKK